MAEQIVTVVTLVDNESVETYVGAVLGRVSEPDRRMLALRFSAHYGDDSEPNPDEDGRDVYFRECDAAASAPRLTEALNASDRGAGGVVRAAS